MKLPMLKSSKDKESASFTFAFIAFNLVCLWLLLTLICPLFGVTVIPAFDGGAAMAFLTPIFTNYFAGKYLEQNSSSQQQNENKE